MLFSLVRSDQRLGYEPTEIGYESSKFGYESSEYETSVGTKRLDTTYVNHKFEIKLSQG